MFSYMGSILSQKNLIEFERELLMLYLKANSETRI